MASLVPSAPLELWVQEDTPEREDAPALLFSNFTEDAKGEVLINMLGASTRRYALAVGLDPDLSLTQLITESRRIMGV